MNSNKTKSKGEVILVRNTEQRIVQPVVIKCPPVKGIIYKNKILETPSERPKQTTTKYTKHPLSEPEFQTTLHIAQNMKKVSEQKLTPKEIWDKIAAEQATKRLNFKPEERVYKDLINLSISSEAVGTSSDSKPSTSRSRTFKKRDISPRLEDYLKPVKFECIKPKFVLPKLPPREPIRVFDHDSVKRHMDRWENADQFSSLCRMKKL